MKIRKFFREYAVVAVLVGREFAVVAQLVEHVIGNDEVTGSIPVNGSRKYFRATLAQLVEHHFRKVGVPGSIPGGGSKMW